MFGTEDASKLRESLGPIRFKVPTERSQLLETYCNFYGLRFGNSQQAVSHSIGWMVSGDFRIVCQHFQLPPAQQRGTVFLAHGYFDHAGLYSHLIAHCLRAGLSVVIFDLPGHGLSSGTPASIASFRQYAAALLACLDVAHQQEVNGPWVLIGQSTGAALILDALLEDALATRYRIAAYILLAPLLRPRNWYRSKLLFLATRWFLTSTRRAFANNSHDQEFLNFLRHSDGLQSRRLQRDWVLAMIDYQQRFARSAQSTTVLHIIQGSGDGTVDWQYNLPQILAKFPESKSYMLADAGHHLVNEAPPWRDRVFSLLDEILGEVLD